MREISRFQVGGGAPGSWAQALPAPASRISTRGTFMFMRCWRLDNRSTEAYNRSMRSVSLLVALCLSVVVCACREAPSSATDQAAAAPVQATTTNPNPGKDLAYVCPMDADVRSAV